MGKASALVSKMTGGAPSSRSDSPTGSAKDQDANSREVLAALLASAPSTPDPSVNPEPSEATEVDDDALGDLDAAPETLDASDVPDSDQGKLKQLLGVLKKSLGVKDLAAVRLSLPANLLEPIGNLGELAPYDPLVPSSPRPENIGIIRAGPTSLRLSRRAMTPSNGCSPSFGTPVRAAAARARSSSRSLRRDSHQGPQTCSTGRMQALQCVAGALRMLPKPIASADSA
jgi:hypothetical protein